MIKLRGITWDHTRGYAPLAASIPVYEQLTGVQVEWDKRSLKDFGDVPVDQLAQDYDLLIIDHPHAGLAAATGALLPLDCCLSNEVLQTLAYESAGPSHVSYSYAGHQWALAVDTAMQAAVYRPDLLDGPLPQSWGDVLALGKRLRRDSRSIAVPLVPTDCLCCFVTICANLGSPPGLDGNLIDDDTGLAALELLIQLQHLCHPQSLAWNPIYMLDHMSSADDVVYCPMTFCYINYSRDGYAPHLLRFTSIPGVRGSILGGAGYAVSARCKHPSEACEYGAWLCSAEIQRTLYVNAGGQPGNRVAWIDDDANALTHDFFRNTLPTLESAYLRPRHNGFVDFQIEAGDIIHAMLRNGTSAANCLKLLRARYAATKDN
jgi:multiple sugar transport system substrate-binding protein